MAAGGAANAAAADGNASLAGVVWTLLLWTGASGKGFQPTAGGEGVQSITVRAACRESPMVLGCRPTREEARGQFGGSDSERISYFAGRARVFGKLTGGLDCRLGALIV